MRIRDVTTLVDVFRTLETRHGEFLVYDDGYRVRRVGEWRISVIVCVPKILEVLKEVFKAHFFPADRRSGSRAAHRVAVAKTRPGFSDVRSANAFIWRQLRRSGDRGRASGT